jgi:hypothetical protein
MGLGAATAVRAGSHAARPPAAVQLTVDQAWFLADALGAGSFPWALAITSPYQDEGQRASFDERCADELVELGVLDQNGAAHPHVADWIRTVCRPDRWLELRYVAVSPRAGGSSGSSGTNLLRGFIACAGSQIVVALRGAQLVAFTHIEADDPSALVPSVVAGLLGCGPARFPAFTLPAQVGAKADEQLRSGSPLDDVIAYLGVPPDARAVVASALCGSRSYVEVVAGRRDGAARQSTEVGLSVVDTAEGRILVSPRRADDGTWLSTFAPGTHFAIAVALDQLTALLPDGRWFPAARLARDFH